MELPPVHPSWPKEFLEIFGSDPEFPSLEEIRAGYGEDAPREPFDDDPPEDVENVVLA